MARDYFRAACVAGDPPNYIVDFMFVHVLLAF
jgi:hypothetical protein